MFKKAPKNLPTIAGTYFIRNFLKHGGMDAAFFTGNQWNIGTRYELPKNHPLEWYNDSELPVNNNVFSIEEVEEAVKELFSSVKIQKGSISTFLRNKFPEKFKS